jgi:hypothetical protein
VPGDDNSTFDATAADLVSERFREVDGKPDDPNDQAADEPASIPMTRIAVEA